MTAEIEQLQARVEELEKEQARLEKEADALHAANRKAAEALANANRRLALARLGISEGDALRAELDTSMGRIRCELFPEEAPLTVLNFVQLSEGTKRWTDPKTDRKVKRPLYDGSVFHRVIPKFMIQGGDPLGTGRGGPGYNFDDETDSGRRFDGPGLLAMANRGPNTNGSQFFITDRAQPTHLDGKHTIFGKCDNLDVVERIATTDRDRRDRPTTPVVLRTVTIIRG